MKGMYWQYGIVLFIIFVGSALNLCVVEQPYAATDE